MKLPSFSVDRPVTVTMMIAIVVVVGLISLSRLGLDLLPEMTYPVISVLTQYPGVASEDIEALITKPIEEVVGSVSGVKSINSSSQEGVSTVMIEFEWGTRLDFAGQDVRDAIGFISDYLPADASEPWVVKFDISMMPMMFYGVTGDMGTMELRELLRDVVKSRLERLDGVASVSLMGGLEREIRVRVDKAKLEALNLSLDQIVNRLRSENLNQPAGHITEGYTELLVRSVGEYEDVAEIGNTVLGATSEGAPIYLRDVAEVRDDHREIRSYGRAQQRDCVLLLLSKQSGANTLKAARKVKKELEDIQKLLPPSVRFDIFFDQSEMISRVTSNTSGTAVVGTVLAVVIILLFLRSWRPTFAISMAIPLSIAATFIPMYFAGYTLNLMTLMGISLGVGMLVDNSIVVIENIFRHIEEGEDRRLAAKAGADEVGMAITASTLTTVAVFFPMVFAGGVAGQLARGLALTISFSLLASLFVALTIVPMIASVFFRARAKADGDDQTDPGQQHFGGVRNRYRKALAWALDHKGRVLLAASLLFVLCVALIAGGVIGAEFMPAEDQPFISMNVSMPVGTSLEETDRIVRQIEEVLAKQDGVKTTAAFGGLSEASQTDVAYGSAEAGVNYAQVMARLYDKGDRRYSSKETMEQIRSKLPRVKGAKFDFVDMGSQMFGGGGSAVEIKVLGADLALLKEISERIATEIEGVPGLRDITTSFKEGKPELIVRIDREKAARYGLTAGQVGGAIQTAMQGTVATQLRRGGDEVDIRVELGEEDRSTVEDVASLTVPSLTGARIPIKQIARVETAEGPVRIAREDQTRKATVTANVAGRDLKSVVDDVKQRVAPIEKGLPSGYIVEYGGQYEQMRDMLITLAWALVLAILLVYMVMAAQFESFAHPFVIMFTMPLALIGVSLMLWATGKTISLLSFMGGIMLAGIVVNNAILLVNYTNQLRKRGLSKRDALIQAGGTRLRPILVTSLTTVFGMLPMALSRSEGAEMRSPLAITVIGGLLAATFLTLFVIPIVYSVFDRFAVQLQARATHLLHGEKGAPQED